MKTKSSFLFLKKLLLFSLLCSFLSSCVIVRHPHHRRPVKKVIIVK